MACFWMLLVVLVAFVGFGCLGTGGGAAVSAAQSPTLSSPAKSTKPKKAQSQPNKKAKPKQFELQPPQRHQETTLLGNLPKAHKEQASKTKKHRNRHTYMEETNMNNQNTHMSKNIWRNNMSKIDMVAFFDHISVTPVRLQSPVIPALATCAPGLRGSSSLP